MVTVDQFREVILNSPAQAPPQGVIPNFIDPENNHHVTKNLLLCSVVAATFMVAVKLYAQICIVRKVYLEDYFFVLAWAIFAFAFAPIGMLINKLPMGVHQWNTRLGPFIQHLFYWYCSFIIYGIIILFLKIVVLLEMIRVFVPAGIRNFTFWTAHIMIWGNIFFYIAFTLAVMFCCQPREKFWDKTIRTGHCMDFLSIHVVGGVICLVSDIMILLLPQRVIFSLQLPLKRKIALSLLFTVGILACTSSVVRVYYIVVLFKTRSDYTWTLSRIGIWAMVQELSGFIVAGLPIFPKVIGHLRKKSWGIRLETKVKSALHISTVKVSRISEKVTTIGGGKRKDQNHRMISDAEFHELVLKTGGTDATIFTNYTHSIKDGKENGIDDIERDEFGQQQV